MQKELVFRIKEKANTEPFEVVRSILVPDNWNDLSIDDRREWLIRPRFYTESGGKTYHSASPFQDVWTDSVYDFWFSETPSNNGMHATPGERRA